MGMIARVLAPPVLGRAFLGLATVTYGLLVFGASVRVHGAGLSCPDWPLCFGKVIPTLDFQVFMEWGHRVLASGVSVGFLTLGALALYGAEARPRVWKLVAGAALALAAQVVLGGLTVLHLLAYWSVTLHLLTGNTFFVLLLLTGLRLRQAPSTSAIPASARAVGLALGAMVVVQMALGGLVSSNYAGLACAEWPSCNAGVWFPALTGPVGLQVIHRLGAYTLLALAGAFAYATRATPALKGPGSLVLGLVLVQAALGITNVLLALPVEIAIAHSAVADLIVASTAWALFRVLTAPVLRPGALILPTAEHA